MLDLSLDGLGAFGAIIAFAFVVLALVLQILFAVAVYRDSEDIVEEGGRTVFVTGPWWTVAVLIGSLPALALYWVIHHSTLRRE